MALAEYGNAFNIDTDGSGNPILIDPQSGDTIAIYDRATGSWQVTTIEAATGDFDSVSAGELANNLTDAQITAWQDGLFVPTGPGLGLSDAVDPGTTTDPLQTATDKVDTAGGGKVLLPVGTYQESTTYTPRQEVSVMGFGKRLQTIIEWPEGVDMIDFSTGGSNARFKNIHFQGAGPGTGVRQDGIVWTSTWQEVVLDNIKISNIYGKAMSNPSGNPFEVSIRNQLACVQIDSGGIGYIIDLPNAGPAWDADLLKFSPVATTSGQDSGLISTTARQFTIGNIQTSGSPGRVIQVFDSGGADVRAIQYEPGASNTTTDRLVNTANGQINVGSINTGGAADYDYVYLAISGIKADYGPLVTGNPNVNVVALNQNPTYPIEYHGPKSDVTDNTGGLSEPNTVYATNGPVL